MHMRLLTTVAAFAALGISSYAAAPPQVPRPAKEFDFAEANGKHSLLSSYKGKVVVIQFLYTTCPHCQAMSQMLTKLQQEYGPRGLQILGAAFNPEVVDPNKPDVTHPEVVRAYVTQLNVNFPVGISARDTVMSFLNLSVLDRYVVPQVAVIDRKGQIREQTEANPLSGSAPLQNEAYLRALIDKLLKETASGAAAPATKSTSATKKAAPVAASTKK